MKKYSLVYRELAKSNPGENLTSEEAMQLCDEIAAMCTEAYNKLTETEI